jgi:hypothetical protein
MNGLQGERRDSLLSGLEGIGALGAKAEALKPEELLQLTLPIRAHLKALDPDVLLVVGGRGAGKSHLFQVLNLPDGPAALGYRPHHRTIWLRGFATRLPVNVDGAFPGETVLQRFAEGKSRTDLMDFWRGLLLGAVLGSSSLKDHVARDVQGLLPPSLQTALRDLRHISTWHEALVNALEDVENALDMLDRRLDSQERYLFTTYDDLDVMAVDWAEKRALLQALLQFWLGGWRRWRRLRPKIFLRRDLLAPEFLDFPDAAKFDAHRMELRWTPLQLYQLVFKLWANQGEDCKTFLEECGLGLGKDDRLGWAYVPPEPTEEGLRACVERVVGRFMGSGPKKGRSYEWIPNHLQDANGEIVPRSYINLFSLAAQDEREHRRASDTLLSPVSFAAAIEETSKRRILELQEEYPWLAEIARVLDGRGVPMDESQLVELLGQVPWDHLERRPASCEPTKLIENMLQIGILRRTRDRRLHVPDIYLYGFGLRRKGGIRRPRTDTTA